MVGAARDTGWFKSSRSGAANESCVEVRITELAVGVRDSKSRGAGQFVFGAPAWHAFLANAKAGRFDA